MTKAIKIISIVVIVVSLLLISGCSTIKQPVLLSLEEVNLVDSDREFIILETDATVANYNWFSVNSKEVKFNIYVDSIFIAEGYLNEHIKISSNDTSSFNSTIKIEKNNLSYLFSSETIDLTIIGFARLPVLNTKYFFEFQKEFPVNEIVNILLSNYLGPDDVTLSEIKMKNIGKDIDLDLSIDIKNSIPMDFDINQFNIWLYSDKSYTKLVGKSFMKDPVIVKKDSKTTITSSVKLNTVSLGGTIIKNKLKNKNTLFAKIRINVEYDDLQLPLIIYQELEYSTFPFKIKIK